MLWMAGSHINLLEFIVFQGITKTMQEAVWDLQFSDQNLISLFQFYNKLSTQLFSTKTPLSVHFGDDNFRSITTQNTSSKRKKLYPYIWS